MNETEYLRWALEVAKQEYPNRREQQEFIRNNLIGEQ